MEHDKRLPGIGTEAECRFGREAVPFEWNFKKYRVGGYGEILFQYMTYGTNRYTNPVGATRDNRAEVSLPRAVFAFDYHFGRGWYLGTEIEFENGGTGATMEIEHNKEGGEIETEIEKGGEVALEQLHITKHFSNAFNLRIGHMIVPVGLTNSHHEPTLFFGTVRPESETAILPSTWHETGIAVLGYLGDFRYEAMLVSGARPERILVGELDRQRPPEDIRGIQDDQSGRSRAGRVLGHTQPEIGCVGLLRQHGEEFVQALRDERSEGNGGHRVVRRPVPRGAI